MTESSDTGGTQPIVRSSVGDRNAHRFALADTAVSTVASPHGRRFTAAATVRLPPRTFAVVRVRLDEGDRTRVGDAVPFVRDGDRVWLTVGEGRGTKAEAVILSVESPEGTEQCVSRTAVD